MKHATLQDASQILLALVTILLCFFRSAILPLHGVWHILASVAALMLTIVSIWNIYKAVCRILTRHGF